MRNATQRFLKKKEELDECGSANGQKAICLWRGGNAENKRPSAFSDSVENGIPKTKSRMWSGCEVDTPIILSAVFSTHKSIAGYMRQGQKTKSGEITEITLGGEKAGMHKSSTPRARPVRYTPSGDSKPIPRPEMNGK